MCLGDSTFRFSDAGQVLATDALHHAQALRWEGWEDDRNLVDGQGLAEWLAAHGFDKPLKDLQASRVRAAAETAMERAWSEAVPGSVTHLLPRMLATGKSGTVPVDLLVELRQAMARAWPDDRDRCRELMAWYGAGTGRYSGYPVYEEIPGTLLSEMSVATVVQVLQLRHDDESAWRGAVRHLAAWKARAARELWAVPKSMRHRLLTVAEGQDEVQARRLRDSWHL
jgi:hypothetical protein